MTTTCHDDFGVVLNDQRQTIFICLGGEREGVSAELGNLLDYLKTGHPKDDFTEECRKEVERLRFDDEWRENYMTLEMKMDERYEAGMEEGKITIIQSQIEKKLEKGKTIEQIADECEESVETIRKCINEMHLSS